MRFFKFIEDLKIRHKLLLGYSAIFILSSILASTTIYHFVRKAIEANKVTTTNTLVKKGAKKAKLSSEEAAKLVEQLVANWGSG